MSYKREILRSTVSIGKLIAISLLNEITTRVIAFLVPGRKIISTNLIRLKFGREGGPNTSEKTKFILWTLDFLSVSGFADSAENTMGIIRLGKFTTSRPYDQD